MNSQFRVIALTLFLAGCSPVPQVTPHPVRGAVERAGKPIVDATVIFHPENPLPAGLHNPLAVTDAAGRYELTTLKQNDGAPAGEYRVTIELRAKRPAGEEHVRDGPHLLPEKFARRDATPFRATVRPEANEIPKLIVP